MQVKRQHKLIVFLTICMLASLLFPVLQSKAADTTEIYVVTEFGEEGGYQVSFKYDSNGLVKKQTNSGQAYNYFYKNGLLVKQTQNYDKNFKDIWIYSYDEDNRLIEINFSNSEKYEYTEKFVYDNNNRVIERTYTESGPESLEGVTKVAYTYNKKGYVTKEKMTGPVPGKTVYTYDKNGIVVSYKSDHSSYSMKPAYQDGLLSSLAIKDKNESRTMNYLYTYKKIKVSKEYLDTVKAQQQAILNLSCFAPQFIFS